MGRQRYKWEGKRLGDLVVLEYCPDKTYVVPSSGKNCTVYRCWCLLCNKTDHYVRGDHLRESKKNGRASNCGCRPYNRADNKYVGKQIGYLLIRGPVAWSKKNGTTYLAICLGCGNPEHKILLNNLRTGQKNKSLLRCSDCEHEARREIWVGKTLGYVEIYSHAEPTEYTYNDRTHSKPYFYGKCYRCGNTAYRVAAQRLADVSCTKKEEDFDCGCSLKYSNPDRRRLSERWQRSLASVIRGIINGSDVSLRMNKLHIGCTQFRDMFLI
jgi:hypothetical protein